MRLAVALGAWSVWVGVGEGVAVAVGTDTSGVVVSPVCTLAIVVPGAMVPAMLAGSVTCAVCVGDGRASKVGVGVGCWADEKIR